MIISNVKVDNDLIAEYVEAVRRMVERSNSLPSGVMLPTDDEERRALHDIILTSVRQSRGSEFSRELNNHVDKLAEKEGWFKC